MIRSIIGRCRQRNPSNIYVSHGRWHGVLAAGLLLVVPSILADPCDPRIPRQCNDSPPSGLCGNVSGRPCVWRSDGIQMWEVGVICRFNVPSCPPVPSNECNYKVKAYQMCEKFSCRNSAGEPCNVMPRFVYQGTVYQPLGTDCQGNPCGPPFSPSPTPIPGTPVLPTSASSR